MNQCDGCQRGLRKDSNGLHYIDGQPEMACTGGTCPEDTLDFPHNEPLESCSINTIVRDYE